MLLLAALARWRSSCIHRAAAVLLSLPVPQEASLGDIPAEERRLLADMAVGDVSVEALLVQPHVQAGMGVHMTSDTGDVLFDMAALYPLLMQRSVGT
jgi:nuclear pore complex protein Nup205